MLGTLGSFCEAFRSALSLLFRFRFSPVVLLWPDREEADAGTADWPGISLGPLSELEGFEEDHRRWWRMGLAMPTVAAALGAEVLKDETRGVGGTAATRRTEQGNMLCPSPNTQVLERTREAGLGRLGVARLLMLLAP